MQMLTATLKYYIVDGQKQKNTKENTISGIVKKPEKKT